MTPEDARTERDREARRRLAIRLAGTAVVGMVVGTGPAKIVMIEDDESDSLSGYVELERRVLKLRAFLETSPGKYEFRSGPPTPRERRPEVESHAIAMMAADIAFDEYAVEREDAEDREYFVRRDLDRGALRLIRRHVEESGMYRSCGDAEREERIEWYARRLYYRTQKLVFLEKVAVLRLAAHLAKAPFHEHRIEMSGEATKELIIGHLTPSGRKRARSLMQPEATKNTSKTLGAIKKSGAMPVPGAASGRT